MKNDIVEMPYRPSWIHSFLDWVERLPIPAWTFYLFILFIGGAIQHLFAWGKGILEVGQINGYMALTWSWLVAQLYYGHLNPHIARKALNEIRPLLDLDDKGFKILSYEVTKIPASPALIMQILGFLVGLAFAAAIRPFSPEINYSFTGFVFFSMGITLAMAFVSFYWIVRQLGMIKRVIKQIKRVDIYNLNSIYGLSRLTASIGAAIILIAFLNYLTHAPQHIESNFAVGFYISFIILALTVFVLPLTEINHRLRDEKIRLLKGVNTQIANTFEKVRKDIQSNNLDQIPSTQACIEIMLKEKALLETIPTWPWAPSTFRGFIAALSSPLFIWLLQEVLERLSIS